jgi:hypothetical protein
MTPDEILTRWQPIRERILACERDTNKLLDDMADYINPVFWDEMDDLHDAIGARRDGLADAAEELGQ